MAWYWILLLVIIYLFGIGVSGAIFDNDECEDDIAAGFGLGLVWPVWMISYLGYIIIKKYKQKDKYNDKKRSITSHQREDGLL